MFESFSDNSKVWIFSGNKFLNEDQKNDLQASLSQFLPQWSAHGTSLKSDFHVIGDHILVVVADEDVAEASGCSIDSLVRKIKEIGNEIHVDFFNRLLVSIEKEGEWKKVQYHDLSNYQGWSQLSLHITSLKDFRTGFTEVIS